MYKRPTVLSAFRRTYTHMYRRPTGLSGPNKYYLFTEEIN